MAETLDVTSMIPNNFESKRKNRFILMIEGIDAYIVKKASRPKISTAPIPIDFMNAQRFVAGKTTFGTMSVSLHEPIAPSRAQQVIE